MNNIFFVKYIRTTFLLSLSVLLLIILSNFIIDPFGIYNKISIPGVNTHKPAFATHVRMSKSIAIHEIKPTSIILGNSRAEYGIDPSHPLWGGQVVYNLGLGNANVYEIYRYLQHAQAIKPLKQVVLMLDFVMFNAIGNREKEDFNEDRLSVSFKGEKQDVSWSDILSPLLSFDAIEASIETVLTQNNIDLIYLSNGMFDPTFRENHIDGYHESFLQNEKGYFNSVSYVPFKFVSKSRDNWDIYKKIIQFAHKNKIDLRMAISPVHARQIEMFYYMDIWPIFEEWKEKLVNINKNIADDFKMPIFPFFDFTGYNKYTVEDLPDIGDKKTKMRWYWESSHYKKELGDLVLNKVLNQRYSENENSNFGFKITSENMIINLRRIREGRKRWREQRPNDVAEIKYLKFL